MTHSEEIETLAPGFPTPWRLVHCQGPRATIQCADGTLFSIGVQAKRHQELPGLVDQILRREAVAHTSREFQKQIASQGPERRNGNP